MPTYNKLVRDRIPEFIEKTGKKFHTTVLSQDAYIKELRKKSVEELEEYMAAETDAEALEELADILEIMHALATVHGSTIQEVEKIRKEKEQKRGGFNERIFLVDVED